ncbi:MAG: hypothetical protein K5695_06490 [Oscillospiraceae bacterium]|nr:hypothetical protein [Oscillospiraceae bacterium]
MNAFKKALSGLKDTYPSPDPVREREFLEQLSQRESMANPAPIRHSRRKPLLYVLPAIAAAVMLAVGIGVYQNMSHERLPMIMQPTETTTMTVDENVNETDGVKTVETEPTEPASEPPKASDAQVSPAATTTAGQGTAALPETAATSPASGRTTTDKPLSTTAQAATQAPQQQTQPAATQKATDPVEKATTHVATDSTQPSTTEFIASPTMPPDEEPDHPFDPLPAEPDDPIDDLPDSTDSKDFIPEETVRKSLDLCVQPQFNFAKGATYYTMRESAPIIMPAEPEKVELQWMCKASDLIVLADVDQFWYTKAGEIVYTQLNIRINTVYKGDLCEGDRLSVYEKGGYMPANIFLCQHPEYTDLVGDAKSIYYPGNETPLHAQRIFFLRRSTDPEIPDGAYVYADKDASSCLRSVGADTYRSVNGLFELTASDLWNACRS